MNSCYTINLISFTKDKVSIYNIDKFVILYEVTILYNIIVKMRLLVES